MSRAYDAYIEVRGDVNKQTEKFVNKNIGDVTLYGGESEDEYVERITKEIWTLEGRFVPVYITMTYLEDLPYEEYEMGKEEYLELMEIDEDEDNT